MGRGWARTRHPGEEVSISLSAIIQRDNVKNSRTPEGGPYNSIPKMRHREFVFPLLKARENFSRNLRSRGCACDGIFQRHPGFTSLAISSRFLILRGWASSPGPRAFRMCIAVALRKLGGERRRRREKRNNRRGERLSLPPHVREAR